MQGAKDLINSERGIFCLFLIAASSVFVMTGKMTTDAWITFAKWIAITLVASKTVTGAVETWTQAPSASPPDLPKAQVVSESK